MYDSPKDLLKKILGRKGESLAVKHLQKKGCKILCRNYRTPFGEADIIAESKTDQGDYLIFIEVKTRTSDLYGRPAIAVNQKKREKYKKIAAYYCKEKGLELFETHIRFDVVEVLPEGITHTEGAF